MRSVNTYIMTQLLLHLYHTYQITVNNIKINLLNPHVHVLVVAAIPMAPRQAMIDPLNVQHREKTV